MHYASPTGLGHYGDYRGLQMFTMAQQDNSIAGGCVQVVTEKRG